MQKSDICLSAKMLLSRTYTLVVVPRIRSGWIMNRFWKGMPFLPGAMASARQSRLLLVFLRRQGTHLTENKFALLLRELEKQDPQFLIFLIPRQTDPHGIGKAFCPLR